MGTCRGRKRFLAQAVKYYQRQTYHDRELVIVDDDPEESFSPPAGVRYIKIKEPMSIGLKMNIAIEAAEGPIIQRFDDDDWVHPTFVEQMVGLMSKWDLKTTVGSVGSFVVLSVRSWKLAFSGNGWFLGGCMCFAKELWRKAPFRDLTVHEDSQFLKDHAAVARPKLTDPELYIVVRHGHGHLWQRFLDMPVDDIFEKHRPVHSRSLVEIMPPEDVAFYESIRKEASCP